MKFGNLYSDADLTKLRQGYKTVHNIGDYLQFITIDSLYDEMGIPEKNRIKLSISEIKNYKGDYMLLPLNYSIFNDNFMENEKLVFSERIIPVFLACMISTIGNDGKALLEETWNRNYLKRHEPIGCRDEYTLSLLRKYGIDAYLTGCLTITLPQYKGAKQGGVYFVDAPNSLHPYIPKKFMEIAQKKTQQYYFGLEMYESSEDILAFTKSKYEEYANADLIVTSRLHVASPCIAMGTPVVLAKDKVDYRFAWIEKFIKAYEYKDFTSIDWFPKPINLENHKIKLRALAKKRIQEVWNKYVDYYKISNFYENVERKNYTDFFEVTHKNLDKLEKHMKKNWNPEEEMKFAVWGVTKATDSICQFIFDIYPKARLVKIYDRFQDVSYKDIKSESPDTIKKDDDIFTIVTGVGASNEAKQLFETMRRPQKMYCLLGTVFL